MLVVGADVAELVGERLDGLRRVDVVANPDDARCEVGVAVGSETAGPTVDPVAIVVDEPGEVIPEPVGPGSRQMRGFDIGQRLTVGLGDVEDVDDLEAAELPWRSVCARRGLTRFVREFRGRALRLQVCGRGLARCCPVDAGREDGDAVLALVDAAAQAVPGADSSDVGGVGPLCADEQDVRGGLRPIASTA